MANKAVSEDRTSRVHSKARKGSKKRTVPDRDIFFVPLCVKNDSTSTLSQELALAHPVKPETAQTQKNGGTENKDSKDSVQDRRLQNALNNVSLDTLVLNKPRIEKLGRDFSHAIEMPQTVSNQRNSGRCWIFALQNIFRKFLIQKFGLPPDYELSASYLAYYDLLEKSNLFLASVWDLRKEDYVENSVLHLLLKQPVSDGGQWNMLLNLVSKYGVVPKYLMPETVHSGSTPRVNGILNQILRSCAWKILSCALKRDRFRYRHRLKRTQKNSDQDEQDQDEQEQFIELKKATIAKIEEVLQLFYGNPPTGPFIWKFQSTKPAEQIMAPNDEIQDQVPLSLTQITELEASCASGARERQLRWRFQAEAPQTVAVEPEQKSVSEENSVSLQEKTDIFRKTKVFTMSFESPSDFYREAILFANPQLQLSQFVCLMHYPVPHRPENKWFTVPYLNNVVNGCESVFFNTSIEKMETAVRNSLDAGEPVWFAADVSAGASWKEGVLDPLSSIDFFGVDKMCENLQNKGVRMQMCGGAPNHAMVIKGYDVVPAEENPSGEETETGMGTEKEKETVQKYLVENSWGTNFYSRHSDVVMSREWFVQHVYNVAVHVRHLEFMKDLLSADKKIYQMSPYEPFGGIL